ncbi:MAG: hypothetical protein JNL72_00620 [Flavipsychrobacter sp.]|nr:hypothetical protein [Flavipsychrobacter sp.]
MILLQPATSIGQFKLDTQIDTDYFDVKGNAFTITVWAMNCDTGGVTNDTTAYEIIKFNKSGLATTSTEYRQGIVSRKTYYYHNKTGYLIAKASYDNELGPQRIDSTSYEYNEDGKRTTAIRFLNGSAISNTSFSYWRNQVTAETTGVSNTLGSFVSDSKSVYTFDEEGRITTSGNGMSRQGQTYYLYNSDGTMKSMHLGSLESDLYWSYDYTQYDKRNNWTERRHFMYGKLSAIERRKIAYR